MLCVFTWLVVACMGQGGDGGYTQYRYPNGQVSSEGFLVNGKPEGYWKSYYENGVLKSEGNRTASQLDSTWKFYDTAGRITTEIAYAVGKKNGPTRKYGESGELLSEELFGLDVKSGDTRTFYPDGKVHEVIPFKEGKEEGKAHEYEQDGRIITISEYRAGLLRSKEVLNRYDERGWRQGFWREYWPNGKPKWEGKFNDDKRQGIFKEYDANGTLKIMEKFDRDEVQEDAEEVKMLTIKNTYHGSGREIFVGQRRRHERIAPCAVPRHPVANHRCEFSNLHMQAAVQPRRHAQGILIESHPRRRPLLRIETAIRAGLGKQIEVPAKLRIEEERQARRQQVASRRLQQRGRRRLKAIRFQLRRAAETRAQLFAKRTRA